MKAITDKPKDNVVLFPKTIDYYQMELTRMLETERYREAIKLLHFLVQCDSGDPRTNEEWQALLDWLRTMQPELYAEEEEDISEEELRRRQLTGKEKNNANYVNELLQILQDGTNLAKQALALEQLSCLDHPSINEALKNWLVSPRLPPILQFKVLQVLKRRGEGGTVTLEKLGEKIVLDIQDTPPSFQEFPQEAYSIVERFLSFSESKHPVLAYFASETWQEFLAYAYGTSIYRELLSLSEEQMDAWACAFHLVLEETMVGTPDEEDILELYGMTDRLKFALARATTMFKSFVRDVFPRS